MSAGGPETWPRLGDGGELLTCVRVEVYQQMQEDLLRYELVKKRVVELEQDQAAKVERIAFLHEQLRASNIRFEGMGIGAANLMNAVAGRVQAKLAENIEQARSLALPGVAIPHRMNMLESALEGDAALQRAYDAENRRRNAYPHKDEVDEDDEIP